MATRHAALAFATLACLVPVARGAAQTARARAVPARRTCDGDTISAVIVRSHPPTATSAAAEAEQASFRLLGLPYVPTRHNVLAAYLRVEAGRVCSELDRSESERLLRAQPFVRSAAVRVITEKPGHSRIEVDVVDELPLIAGGSVSHGTVSSVLLGTQNLEGRGLAVTLSAERGFAYRNGFGVSVVKYGMFGRPDFLRFEAAHDPVVDDRLSIELAEPFLTDLQSRAYHASAMMASGYVGIVRPVGDDISLFLRRVSYDAGWVTRLGAATGHRVVGLVGLALVGEDVLAGNTAVIVTDTAVIAGPPNPFGRTYPVFAVTRVAAIAGLRDLRFTTVRGFDALKAEQDMGIGVQADLLVGPNVSGAATAGDVLIASDLYAGVGDARSFFVARALAEARANRVLHRWDGLVSSARLAWYGKRSEDQSQQASIELSSVQHLDFPLQLTFRDADGGLPGSGDSRAAGGQRVIVRAEQRYLTSWFSSRADVAFALFAAAGKLWAGDVPYGQTTNVRATAGVSLLAAYPSGGKRTYRVDLAFPLNPERGGSRFELRLSATDRTRLLWLEPNDVARARTGDVPASLMKW